MTGTIAGRDVTWKPRRTLMIVFSSCACWSDIVLVYLFNFFCRYYITFIYRIPRLFIIIPKYYQWLSFERCQSQTAEKNEESGRLVRGCAPRPPVEFPFYVNRLPRGRPTWNISMHRLRCAGLTPQIIPPGQSLSPSLCLPFAAPRPFFLSPSLVPRNIDKHKK